MVPELCFGFIFLIIMLQNSTTAKQDGVLRGSEGTKLDVTLDKYKHTQQGTAWRSLWGSIASLSPKTPTSPEVNSRSFSVTIIRVSFTHLSANCLLLPPTALSHNNTSFLALKTNKKLSLELWQCPHDHLAGGSMTMIWQASPHGDCTHQSRCWHTPHPEEPIHTRGGF